MEEIGETSGLLYKRRGGFGKMMPQNWLQRYFVISKEGFLTYYDTDLPDKINIDTKSRGKIDLKTASYEFLEDQSAATELGEPTPFSIIIIPFGEERWKLCASTKEEFEKWTKGLQQIAIKVRNDSSKAIEDSGLKSIQTNVTQSTLIQKHPKRASTRQTMKLKKNTSSDFVELILTLLIMNLSYHLAAESTPPRKYIFAALATVVVGLTLTQRNRRGNDESVQSDEKHVDLIKKNAGVDESSTIALKQRPVPGMRKLNYTHISTCNIS